MAVGSQRGGFVHAVKIDVKRLHETWMELVFPRQRNSGHSVLGKWTPNTTSGWIAYRLWAAIGAVVVAVLYPMVVAGFATRFYVRRLDGTAARLGIVGVVVLTAVAWGALTAIAYLRFPFEAFLAVLAAAVVAVVSAALAVVFARVDGRPVTVLFAYPFGVTAFLLPPVVAAFFSPALAALVFSGSDTLSIWFLQTVAEPLGVADRFRETFDLTGLMYVAMWFVISIPVGWGMGILVTLADVVRPERPSGTATGDGE